LEQVLPLADAVPLLFGALIVYGIAEGLHLHLRRRVAVPGEYRMMGLALGVIMLASAVVLLLFGPFNAVVLALWGSGFAPLHAGLSPVGWLYGLVVYELAYWLQHWLAHKVRLLWCIHAPHHAPTSMNLFVGFNHSFLESVFYMPLALGLLPALLGVHPLVIAVVSLVDIVWGNLLHISDHVVTRRYGVLERFLQTPSYHRVHHGRNVRYVDTNYNSITLLWDWLLGTLQPLDDSDPVAYGITREVDTRSFRDVHFGDFRALWRDVRAAPNGVAGLLTLLKPPGWSATGASNTAAARKRRWLAQSS
jgi:sterol desaturase/sphingolipid hydroxylase (fatty acid hydroxylase superfamily)